MYVYEIDINVCAYNTQKTVTFNYRARDRSHAIDVLNTKGIPGVLFKKLFFFFIKTRFVLTKGLTSNALVCRNQMTGVLI